MWDKKREEKDMPVLQSKTEPKVNAVKAMHEMAQNSMKAKKMSYSELSRKVGLKRYEK